MQPSVGPSASPAPNTASGWSVKGTGVNGIGNARRAATATVSVATMTRVLRQTREFAGREFALGCATGAEEIIVTGLMEVLESEKEMKTAEGLQRVLSQSRLERGQRLWRTRSTPLIPDPAPPW